MRISDWSSDVCSSDLLAEKSTFLETCYLLLNGELPNGKQRTDFEHSITNHTMLHEQIHFLFRGFRRDAHPMAVMCGVVGALSAFYHDQTDYDDPKQRMIAQRSEEQPDELPSLIR